MKRISKSKIKNELNELRMLWGGYWSSKILLTANNLKVFEYLKTPRSAQKIASLTHSDLRATEILLNALTAFRLLKKSGNKYKNSPIANRFLTSDSPYYHGNIIKHLDTLWWKWSDLDNIIKTGKPSSKPYDHSSFIRGMHDISKMKAANVIKLIGLKGVKRALDLGGGPGTYSIEMAKKGISVTLFDLPETIDIAKDIIMKEGSNVIQNIDFLCGDFLTDDIGKNYDLIFISQVLHAFSEEDNAQIIQKSCNAINKGGRIVVQEFYIDDKHIDPFRSAIFSVNMLVSTNGGRCYSPTEIKNWFTKAGVKNFQEKFFEDCLILIALS